MKNKNVEGKKQPLVVTTDKRGVFFGYAEPVDGGVIRLEQAQMCVYWSADVKGVLGLASGGPSKGCRITAPINAIRLQGVTSIMEVTEKAEAAWKTQPWS